MPKPEPEPLHLRRIDAARNMRRFYALSAQPTLFGEMSLFRNWGRIGTSGKTMVRTFDGRAEAKGHDPCGIRMRAGNPPNAVPVEMVVVIV